jgi:hypothetical protein
MEQRSFYGFLDGFQYLFNSLGVQRRAPMERDHDPSATLRVDSMTTLRSQPNKPAFNNVASASAAVSRGTLGMHFDCGSKNLPAEQRRALVLGQSLQKQLDRLTDIGERFLDRLSLRLASPQLGAPSVTSFVVLFDYNADLARH